MTSINVCGHVFNVSDVDKINKRCLTGRKGVKMYIQLALRLVFQSKTSP